MPRRLLSTLVILIFAHLNFRIFHKSIKINRKISRTSTREKKTNKTKQKLAYFTHAKINITIIKQLHEIIATPHKNGFHKSLPTYPLENCFLPPVLFVAWSTSRQNDNSYQWRIWPKDERKLELPQKRIWNIVIDLMNLSHKRVNNRVSALSRVPFWRYIDDYCLC